MLKQRTQHMGIEYNHEALRAILLNSDLEVLDTFEAFLKESQTSLSSALIDLRNTWTLNRTWITLGVPHDMAIIKTLQLDSTLNDQDIVTYCKANSAQVYGLNFDELYFDYQKLAHKPNDPCHHIQTVAIRKEKIEPIIKDIIRAGLIPHALNINSLAINHAVNSLFLEEGDCVATVSLEPSRLLLCITHQQELIYVKYEDYIQDSSDNVPAAQTAFNRVMQYYKSLYSYPINRYLLVGPSKKTVQLENHISYQEHKLKFTALNDLATQFVPSYGLALQRVEHGC